MVCGLLVRIPLLLIVMVEVVVLVVAMVVIVDGGSNDGGMERVMELVNFFCEILDNKYFRLCKPYDLYTYDLYDSTLPL